MIGHIIVTAMFSSEVTNNTFPDQFVYITTKQEFNDFVTQNTDRILMFSNPDCTHCNQLYKEILLKGGIKYLGPVGFIRNWEEETETKKMNVWLNEKNLFTLPLIFPHSLYLNCVNDECRIMTTEELRSKLF